jgi:NADP-dependent 3-hydroxy acid dehydrogenase YdfG
LKEQHDRDDSADDEETELDDEIIVEDEESFNWADQAAQRREENPDEELKHLLDLQEKESLAKKTIMSDQNGEDRLYYEMALFKYQQGLYEEARQYYEKSKTINPKLGTKRNENAFSRKGPLKYEEAMQLQAIPEQSAPGEDQILTVLITGATSGIGRATAERFAREGHQLILTGRRKKRLKKIKVEWENQFDAEIDILKFDIRDMEDTVAALSQLRDRNIDILVNNAGLASGLSEIHEGDIEDWERMIDTNIKGLLYTTRSIAPQMVARGRGHIINIGSIAGKQAYPKGNVYNASKFAVDGLTQAMRMDLHKYNIRVSQIAPGHVEETEFAKVRFHGDEEKAKIYEDFNPVTSRDIAEIIYFMATQPDHITIQDVLVAGTQQASATMIDRSGRKFDK